jgi:lipopolysaccharide/colanic/teichoic acid biosynthesis glycosyltransferase
MNFSRPDLRGIIKVSIDYICTIICLILLIPVILILAIIIKISGKGPVLYSQKRVGRYGKSFTIYKFRSMHEGNRDGFPLLSGKNDKRLTPVGRFMRKHKLDEIPNFINVLKGEMSLVGPRPEQKYFIDQIVVHEPKYSILHNVKPGITSWGQVKYGYASNVKEMVERLEYDLYYYEKRSLWFDFKIVFYTAGAILRGEGV